MKLVPHCHYLSLRCAYRWFTLYGNLTGFLNPALQDLIEHVKWPSYYSVTDFLSLEYFNNTDLFRKGEEDYDL